MINRKAKALSTFRDFRNMSELLCDQAQSMECLLGTDLEEESNKTAALARLMRTQWEELKRIEEELMED